MNAYTEVVAKPHPHLNDLPKDQRRVRLLYENSVDMHDMIVEFLASDPPVPQDFKSFLHDWAAAHAEWRDLHKKMISDDRYEYTEAEQERNEVLLRATNARAFELGDHLK